MDPGKGEYPGVYDAVARLSFDLRDAYLLILTKDNGTYKR